MISSNLPVVSDTVKVDTNAFKCKNVDFDYAVEQTGFGRYNITLILICGICLFATNTEAYSIGFIVPSAENEFNLNTYTKGIITSANFLGIMGTCTIWGYLSDIKGRKNLLMINFFLTFITSIAAALITSFWGFVILRFINGICISGPSAIIFAYFGEFQGNKQRSKGISYISLFIAGALIYLPGAAWGILKNNIGINFWGINITPWRVFMLLNALPNIAAAFGLMMLPESPKYLYQSGKLTEALDILKKIYAVNTDEPEDSFPITSLNDKVLLEKDTERKSILQTLWRQVSELFQPPHWIYTLAGCFMQAGVFAISSGLYMWYPDILNQLSKNSGQSDGGLTVCQALGLSQQTNKNSTETDIEDSVDDQIFIQNLIIGSSYLIGYAAWGALVNALGNKNFFNICMIVSSVGIIILCFVTQKLLIDIFFVIVLTLPGITVAVINASMVDIIPTHLCGMAVCIIMTAGRLGSIISSSIVGIMLEWSCTTTFVLYALSLIVCLLLSLLFPKKS